MAVKCRIYTCPEWKARKAASQIYVIPASPGIIFHHTAGHHPEISNPRNESLEEAFAFARAMQRQHQAQGWADSGHNFTVCRNGVVLQGRWKTVSAIQHGRMVHSAHCPDYNGWIGIEHEHFGSEKMPKAQFNASARLQAWIADQYGRGTVLPVDPHSAHFPTECPANLRSDIPAIRKLAQNILSEEG